MTTLTRYVLRFSFASLLVSYRPLARKGQPKPILRTPAQQISGATIIIAAVSDALLC